MFKFFLKGGPLMWPILFCSIVSIAVILERCYYFYRSRDKYPNLPARVKKMLRENKTEEALKLCESISGPIAHILAIGVYIRGRGTEEKEKLISRAGSKFIRQMESNLRGLAVIGTTAPLLGLLGTVTGMIRVFMRIQELGAVADAQMLAGGIWEALITTAAGLFVAIPSLVAYHYFEGKVDNTAGLMKEAAMELIDPE